MFKALQNGNIILRSRNKKVECLGNAMFVVEMLAFPRYNSLGSKLFENSKSNNFK